MKDELVKLAERVETVVSGMMRDLAEIPSVKRGKVFCHTCGNVEDAGVECFRTGWPKCCGYTMSLDSPEERRALTNGDSDG